MPFDVAPRRRPRILYIGTGTPWNGGAGFLMRQHLWLQALTEFADVHAVLFTDQASVSRPPYACTITRLPAPPLNSQGRIRWMLEEWFSPVPQMVRRFSMDAAQRTVHKLRPMEFDAVFAYRIDFANFAGVLDCPHLLLDIDDPEHLRRRQRMEIAGIADGAIRGRLDLIKLRRFERAAVAKAQAAFVCQERDREAFADPKPFIVPNAIEVPTRLPARQIQGPTILFVGNLSHAAESPNVDGMFWFVDRVWPLILQRSPQCVLQIAGPISDDLRSDFSGRPSVQVMGFVDEITSLYPGASLSIAPIRIGTGTRIKILESMAWGCPVVSTSKGSEGLPAQHERHLLIADDPACFAAACTRLICDHGLQHSLAHAGYALVSEHFDQARLHSKLVHLLRGLVREASPVAAA